MTDSVFDVALEKRFSDSAEITTIDVNSTDTLLIRDSATGVIMRLPFSTLAEAISSAFGSSFAALIDGKVPSSQLPSYVDDVLEYANVGAFPATGESGKIYISLATNLCYRWSGSTYVEISSSPGSTDVVSEGSTNKYYIDARARAAVSSTGSLSYNQTTGVFSFTDAVTSVAGKTGTVLLGQSDISGLTTSNSPSFNGLNIDSSGAGVFKFANSGVNRWYFQSAGTETGGDNGSDFYLFRYSDSGVFLGTTFVINRKTGFMRLLDLPTFADNASAALVADAGTIYKTATGEIRIVF